MIVGIDEAGRGPLAGSVVGCAVYLKKDLPFAVRDSKELSAAAREKIFPWLIENAVIATSFASAKEIDTLNVLEATMLTFNRAIAKIIDKAPYLKKATFIVDGNIFRTKLPIRYVCVEKADKTVKQVSCASIVAKVFRDYLMQTADFLYPEWQFSGHKGYPTREHFSLIEKYKISPLHRKTFFPCNKFARR